MDATKLLDLYRAKQLRIATAESCTGGMIAATITDIAGSSDVFERGFVTYSNEAKTRADRRAGRPHRASWRGQRACGARDGGGRA